MLLVLKKRQLNIGTQRETDSKSSVIGKKTNNQSRHHEFPAMKTDKLWCGIKSAMKEEQTLWMN